MWWAITAFGVLVIVVYAAVQLAGLLALILTPRRDSMQAPPPPTRVGEASKSDPLGVNTTAFDAASVRLIKKVALDTKTHPGEEAVICSGSWLIDHTPTGTDAASPKSDSSSSDGGGGASVAATRALLYDGRATEAALSTKYPARFRTPNKATIQQRFYGHGTTWLDGDRIGAVREPNVVQLWRGCGAVVARSWRGCGVIVG
jgi:hypothetical protein